MTWPRERRQPPATLPTISAPLHGSGQPGISHWALGVPPLHVSDPNSPPPPASTTRAQASSIVLLLGTCPAKGSFTSQPRILGLKHTRWLFDRLSRKQNVHIRVASTVRADLFLTGDSLVSHQWNAGHLAETGISPTGCSRQQGPRSEAGWEPSGVPRLGCQSSCPGVNFRGACSAPPPATSKDRIPPGALNTQEYLCRVQKSRTQETAEASREAPGGSPETKTGTVLAAGSGWGAADMKAAGPSVTLMCASPYYYYYFKGN